MSFSLVTADEAAGAYFAGGDCRQAQQGGGNTRSRDDSAKVLILMPTTFLAVI